MIKVTIKIEFDAAGIEIPFPQRTLTFINSQTRLK